MNKGVARLLGEAVLRNGQPSAYVITNAHSHEWQVLGTRHRVGAGRVDLNPQSTWVDVTDTADRSWWVYTWPTEQLARQWLGAAMQVVKLRVVACPPSIRQSRRLDRSAKL